MSTLLLVGLHSIDYYINTTSSNVLTLFYITVVTDCYITWAGLLLIRL